MFESLQSLVTPALMQRFTLLLNHVLSSEAVAMQRLKPHAGRRVCLVVAHWPQMLPAWPTVAFVVTPAGLLEWQGPEVHAESNVVDLTLTLEASNPVQLLLQFLSGQKPRVDVSGDAAFAGDVSWLMDNLRWDIKDDIARWVGPMPAQQLGQLAQAVANAVREKVQRWTARSSPNPDAPPPSPPAATPPAGPPSAP